MSGWYNGTSKTNKTGFDMCVVVTFCIPSSHQLCPGNHTASPSLAQETLGGQSVSLGPQPLLAQVGCATACPSERSGGCSLPLHRRCPPSHWTPPLHASALFHWGTLEGSQPHPPARGRSVPAGKTPRDGRWGSRWRDGGGCLGSGHRPGAGRPGSRTDTQHTHRRTGPWCCGSLAWWSQTADACQGYLPSRRGWGTLDWVCHHSRVSEWYRHSNWGVYNRDGKRQRYMKFLWKNVKGWNLTLRFKALEDYNCQ